MSNEAGFLSNLHNSHMQIAAFSLNLDTGSTVKILPMKWNPICDSFTFSMSLLKKDCTKHTLLAEKLTVFDQYGFLVPISLVLNLFIEQLWTLRCNSDEPVPLTMNHETTVKLNFHM